MMTQADLLALLNSVDFSRQYWELCDRFPPRPGAVKMGTKQDFLAVFTELGIKPRYESETFTFEEEDIGGVRWSAVLVKQRAGLELNFEGAAGKTFLGSNLAVLAYDARQLADPTFVRDRFNGPPPYPRPDHHGDSAALKEIVQEFARLVRLIKDRLRTTSGS